VSVHWVCSAFGSIVSARYGFTSPSGVRFISGLTGFLVGTAGRRRQQQPHDPRGRHGPTRAAPPG
jgi:hypothetical protein